MKRFTHLILTSALVSFSSIACDEMAEDPSVDQATSADTISSATCLVPRIHPVNGYGPLWVIGRERIAEARVFYWHGSPYDTPEIGPGFSITSIDKTVEGRLYEGSSDDGSVTVRIPLAGEATVRVQRPSSTTITAISRVDVCDVGP